MNYRKFIIKNENEKWFIYDPTIEDYEPEKGHDTLEEAKAHIDLFYELKKL
ncbi:hypothetical protein [Paenibacillus donghaensis]|uniref:hypothetical protein n=1 Tax=Paenibacillus donghaensis TaxID=414771 RepID=UPI0012F855C0|nr:hypothetical protein [Paenibacillus donghaensis]